MRSKNKAEIIASNPNELNPSDLKKYNNWKQKGTGPSGAGKKLKPVTLGTTASNGLEKFSEEIPHKDYVPQDMLDNPPFMQEPPLELSEKEQDDILLQQAKDDLQRVANNSNVVTYNNKTNVWRLIQRTVNETLGVEKLVLAMAMGKTGVMMMVSDKTDSKVAMSTCYMHDCVLQKVTLGEDEHWIIK